jgi:L-malate glycosyltransferase
MKILFLIHSLRKGGAERVVLNQADGLAQKGHNVHIISWLDNDEYQSEYQAVKRSFLIEKEDYKWVSSLRSSSLILNQKIQSYKPDFIQIHTPTMIWLLGLINNKIPSLHILHGYGSIEYKLSIKSLLLRLITIYFTKKINNQFVTVSPSMISTAAKYYSNSESEYTVIQNGIDVEKFPFIANKVSSRVNLDKHILMIGTLTANKGQLLAIDAFQLLLKHQPSTKLLIIGDGEDKSIIKEKIQKLNLASCIKLLGIQNNIQSFLSRGSVLWQFSKTEAMPMTVLESMASGLPVVGFDVRGINDAVIHEETGFLVPYGDISQAACRTLEILSDDALHKKLALNSRQRIIKEFTNTKMVDSYEMTMQRMLS